MDLIVQISDRAQADRLHVTREVHESYCKRHGFDYAVKLVDEPSKLGKFWVKIEQLIPILHSDYSTVIYFDTDVLIYDHTVDLRKALYDPEADFGMVPYVSNPDDYYNAGAIYMHNTVKSRNFFNKVLATGPDTITKTMSDGSEERIINRLLWTEDIDFLPISTKWNSFQGTPHAKTVVKGFHGCKNRVIGLLTENIKRIKV